jgi:guanylate kinase
VKPSSNASPDRPRRGRLLVLLGPSGVGKSTVLDAVADRAPFHFSVSATTRPARPGEQNGVDYHFIDRGHFEDHIARGDLLEWAEYSGNLYGTLRSEVTSHIDAGEHVVLDIEIQGARQVKAALPETIVVFLAPPDLVELERRLRDRGDTVDVEERLEIARRDIVAAELLADYRVLNVDLDRAVSQVVGILRGAAEGAADDEETPPHDD